MSEPTYSSLFAKSELNRFLGYRTKKSRSYLCVCAARDKRHALKIARQMFQLDRTAYAVPEGRPQP